MPMRHTLLGTCIVVALCLAQAGATTSSSAHKHKVVLRTIVQIRQKTAHGRNLDSSSAQRSGHSAGQRTGQSAVRNAPVRNTAHPRTTAQHASKNRSLSRNPDRPNIARTDRIAQTNQVALHTSSRRGGAHVVVSTPRHRRQTVGEARLERIRELNTRSRTRHSLETEYQDRSSLIEQPVVHRLTRFLAAMVSPLRGSHESLVRQNTRSDDEGLERIEDDEDLNDRIASKSLVKVPTSSALAINGNLPDNRRYCRPWTATFLSDLAHAHNAEFHSPLVVTSAVRTVEFQKHLMGFNGNAAPAEGDVASPHLTGGSIDIGKHGMSRQEITWMRTWLLLLQQANKIDVEEEFKQACFHITVYKSYMPDRPQHPRQPVKADTEAGEVATAGE